MAYSKVERRIHDDERFRRWTRDVRQMWQYLLTTKHGNRLGLFVLDPLYAVADLSAPDDRWTEGRFFSALEVLAADERLAYDPDTRLVLLFNHLEHNAPENPNVVKGALPELAELPFSASLFPRFAAAVRQHCRTVTEKREPFAQLWIDAVEERIRKGSAKGSGNGFGKGMPNPEPEPEPEPTTDTVAKATDAGRHESNPDPDGAPEPTPAPPEPAAVPDPEPVDAGEDVDMRTLYAEMAPLVREHLWQGSDPPPERPGGKPLTMNRELTVARQLVAKYGRAEVAGAIRSAREALGWPPGRPLSLLFFNRADGQQYLHLALEHWRRRAVEAAPGLEHLLAGIGNGGAAPRKEAHDAAA